jgi:hypothetical protein
MKAKMETISAFLIPDFFLRLFAFLPRLCLFFVPFGESESIFDILKMRAIFKPIWVRKLIGKLGVPYNRRLRVRGSPHPLNYDADLSLPAADSNAFRNQSGLEKGNVEVFEPTDFRTRALILE